MLAKAASSFERDAFDLHLLPYSRTHPGDGRRWHAGAGALCPGSRGRVMLESHDSELLSSVDHGFLTDEEGHDAAVLAEGVALLSPPTLSSRGRCHRERLSIRTEL